MIVEYEGEKLTFDLDEIDVQQATVLKRKLGLTLLSLDAGLTEGDPDALRAVYWLMLVQSGHKGVDIDDVNFKIVKLANAIQDAADKENAEKAEGAEDAEGADPKDE
jgi:hypothetical protein